MNIELLRAIHKKPGMYFGDTPFPFTSFVALHAGYSLALHTHSLPGELVPQDFHRYVAEHFHHPTPDDTRGWMTHIRDHTSSEQEAFELLFRLLESYHQARRDHPAK
jgi:hypothetical protein